MTDGRGGIRGLRTWARDAMARADLLIPFHRVQPTARGGVVLDQALLDQAVEELTELERLLGAEEPHRIAVVARLGALLTSRYTMSGAAEDRERALVHLRRVREPDSQAPRWERQCAALCLLLLMAPHGGGGIGSAPGFPAAMNWSLTQIGRSGLAEVPALLADIEDLPMPPELRAVIEQLAPVAALAEELLRPGAVADAMTEQRLWEAMPADFPYKDELRGPAASMGPRNAPGAPSSPRSGAVGGKQPDRDPVGSPGQAKKPGSERSSDGSPGGFSPEISSALLATAAALGTGDPALLDTAVREITEVTERLPQDHAMALSMKAMRAALLHSAHTTGGSLQDGDFAHRVTEAMKAGLAEAAPSSGPDADALDAIRVLSALSRTSRAEQSGDLAELEAILNELLGLHARVPKSHASSILVPLALSQVYQARGALLGDESESLRGLAHLEECAQSAPPPWNETMGGLIRQAKLMRGHYESDPALIEESLHDPVTGDQAMPVRRQVEEQRTALGLLERYEHTDDPADLDQAIARLERTRERARQGQDAIFAADALWHLVRAYWLRWFRTQSPEELHAATDAGLDALHAVSADVLLQAGSEHGLLVARSAADRGHMTARTAIGCGRLEAAVTALELGRALVLQAASTSAGVPELLEARGHREIADTWRRTAPDTQAEGGRLLPSSLRRRALEALGYRQHGRQRDLFATPTTAELRAGVAAGGADVLVYLLPGKGEAHGVAIALGPDLEPTALDLPQLFSSPSGPLAEYLNAAAARSRVGGDVAERRWERVLDRLCDWASYTVVEPLMRQIEDRLTADAEGNAARSTRGPLRVVLVPCGNLGVVPWHAARRHERSNYRYACQDLVLTYAASGSQFLAAVSRDRIPVDAAPVLVADPRMDLPHAEREIIALHSAFYPQARLYGEFYEPPVPPRAPGTPEDVLGALPGASLLHVASHGSAGPRPTVSALCLAFPDDGAPWSADRGGPGTVPDEGMLTVTRLLDLTDDGIAGPVGAAASGSGGPLVVLSACETDLSTRDHDEALTLTTAFVARGARNAVGSRWRTDDSASALMMAVFHHFLSVEGQGPADALRSAQLWMLDPERKVPESVSGHVAREAQLPGLDRIPAWAAFVHQGHPGPAPDSAAMEGSA
ncbi:CHAT domain-containing protein [Streptomyces sp. XD-27]|uniref:CHAT domain-containing protein n=1 Tax=Streptomyces sp. XD-27 TaxID=3062779 RepID=UPI0026F4318D|nr:CHAT domain-containing protein [Streptomyces sp. XD-27]WKX69541.1 CHAT domain-containing protein [Streptomyces sp. XD-27]